MSKTDARGTGHTSTIGFYGGVGSVTGANFLINTGNTQILLDCGMVQGDRFAAAKNQEPFPYNPADVSTLIVSHAHADHIGRIPKLVRDGFQGVIYSTTATRDLAEVMLRDAYKIMRMESKRYHEPVLYEESDIDAALALWKGVAYKEEIRLSDGVSGMLYNAGHILGSSFIELSRNGRQMVYTGDVGNIPQPLLDAPDMPTGYQYLITESVYGDRVHEEVDERAQLLLSYIKDTIASKGTLIIPAFSLERTQSMLFEINNFVESGMVEPIPVFLDSPLAIAVTGLYRKHQSFLKKEVRTQIAEGDDIFAFPKLSFTRSVEDSREIARTPGPKIIIAGSGMSHGGRIRTHEKHYLSDPDTTLLLVGYQAVGSMGRRLQDGVPKIQIDGVDVRVRARIATISGYSGHADREGLMDLVAAGGDHIEQIFVAMGEEKSSLFLTQRLRGFLGANAVAPETGSVVSINL